MNTRDQVPELLTSAEVAARFRVDPKTVTRWAKAGRLTMVRTPGGHCRYYEAEVQAMLSPERLPHRPVIAVGGQPR